VEQRIYPGPRLERREMDDAQELLFAMTLAAQGEARQHLSEEGYDVLEMINLVSRTSEVSVVDAWVEARATATLSERDRDILMAYVARMSLIERFDSHLSAAQNDE
jgi:hypothetical protein